MNKKLFFRIFVHLLFCTLTILFFRLNSFLRPLVTCAIYKEYIAGGIVLIVFYLNYFLLYPKLYEERRFVSYVIVSMLVLAVASLLEERLVYFQVYEIIKYLDIDRFHYFANQTGVVFLRDACFFLFSFMVSVIRALNEEKHDLQRYLHKQNHLIVAKTILGNDTVTISDGDITHCQQIENYAYLYLLNGNVYTKNCTLSDLSGDIGPECCVRISRSVVVMYAYIQSFDQNTVIVQTHKGIEGFTITNYYKDQALSQIKSHVIGSKVNNPDVVDVNVYSENSFNELFQENTNDEQISPIAETGQVDEPQVAQQVLSFISEHPGCKSTDLTGQFHVSLSTVNRILRQLKADGLITYEGSKKTGGYRAVGS